ncbi:hypothetical protein KSP40_PGU004782 [Platanthera guangdongensis]|uniref:Uncharacterized protein n=1 Tax=Platanthera guangdongensis TaxID=2320717 RepID=A0ABR2N320_9ASPA
MNTTKLSHRLHSPASAFSSIFFLLLVFNQGIVLAGGDDFSPALRKTFKAPSGELRFAFNRKLLDELPGGDGGVAELDRVGETQCTKDDILVHQQATEPLPSGIPTYTVNVLSTCPATSGCAMAHIHVGCGWFSTAREINPDVFRRLGYNHCLLNGGRPLPGGFSVSFQYANTFPYRLSISSAECVKI